MEINNLRCIGLTRTGGKGCGCSYPKVTPQDIKLARIYCDGIEWLIWTCPNCTASKIVLKSDPNFKQLAGLAVTSKSISAPIRENT